jgi:hypothetical protein
MAVMLVLAAVMMRAIADSIVAYQNQVHVIDRNVTHGVPATNASER